MDIEYTLISILVLIFVFFVDVFVLKTKVILHKYYFVYLPFIFIFFFGANQYLTCRPIVLYNQEYILGLRIGCVPLEDFIFNISLVTLPISLWVWSGRKSNL
jgi:lycopene cyclase domain-containing protein